MINTFILYQSNAEFKEYVDKYSRNYNEGKSIPVDIALTHRIVRDYAEWLLRRV